MGDFLPEIVNRDAKLIQANEFLNKVYENGFGAFAKSHTSGLEAIAQPYGIEQLYFEWIRTAFCEEAPHRSNSMLKTSQIRWKPEIGNTELNSKIFFDKCVETRGEASELDDGIVRSAMNLGNCS